MKIELKWESEDVLVSGTLSTICGTLMGVSPVTALFFGIIFSLERACVQMALASKGFSAETNTKRVGLDASNTLVTVLFFVYCPYPVRYVKGVIMVAAILLGKEVHDGYKPRVDKDSFGKHLNETEQVSAESMSKADVMMTRYDEQEQLLERHEDSTRNLERKLEEVSQ